jgi:Spy/CpxP family protein refolding chaperone
MKTKISILSVFIFTLVALPSAAQRGQGPGANQEYMEWKLRKDLGLNDDQIVKIKELRDKHQAQAEADRKELREEMEAKREAIRKEMQERRQAMQAKAEKRQEEMKSILTPEQYEKWQEMRFQNIENRMQNRKMRQGDRPMRGGMQLRGEGPNRPGNMRGYRNAPRMQYRGR